MQIVWGGNLLDYTGYSKAAREYLLALHSFGIDVKIEPFFPPLPQITISPEHLAIFRNLMAKPKSKFHKVHIYHQIPEMWKRKLHPTIGFTYWETSKIPANWVRSCHQMNAVFVSSRHNLEVFRSSGVQSPLYYIRPCLSPSTFHPDPAPPPHFLHHLPPFRFLSVFSWIERKGYDLLLKAFWEEFSAKDDVALVIKTSGSPPNILGEIEQLKHQFQIFHSTAPIHVDFEIRSEGEMDVLYRSCRAFVYPTRGEGIGYPLLEAAARRLPIIATGWGGHTDLLNEHNSYPIPYNLVPVKPQPYYPGYQSDQLWAEASVGELKKRMRLVYENYSEAAGKGAAAEQDVRNHFSHEQAVRDLISAVQQIMRVNL